MRSPWLRLLPLAALFLVAVPAPAEYEIKGKLEALVYQDNYKNAIEIAREWKQDCILYRADVLNAKRDGTVNAGEEGDGSIAYFFCSPSLFATDPSMGGSFRAVTIAKGKIAFAPPPDDQAEAHQQAPKRHLPGDPVGVHQPAEMAEKRACDFGTQLNGWLYPDAESQRFIWYVTAAPAGSPGATADAMTGELLRVDK